MNYLFLILVLLSSSITACGEMEKLTEEEVSLDADPVLEYYLQQYIMWAPNQGKLDRLVSLKFGTLDETGENGECKWSQDNKREITIRRPAEMDARFARIMMHEFGHCLHDLKHSPDKNSVMYAKVHGTNEYWEEHLEEKTKAMFN